MEKNKQNKRRGAVLQKLTENGHAGQPHLPDRGCKCIRLGSPDVPPPPDLSLDAPWSIKPSCLPSPPSLLYVCPSLESFRRSPGMLRYHACMHHGPANKLHRVATPLPLSLSCQVEPLKHSPTFPFFPPLSLSIYPSIFPSVRPPSSDPLLLFLPHFSASSPSCFPSCHLLHSHQGSRSDLALSYIQEDIRLPLEHLCDRRWERGWSETSRHVLPSGCSFMLRTHWAYDALWAFSIECS